ncbi:ABC transporter ATP-binding protein [Algoriphagus marinus]|uniref:ABC transporter ATP-binding protein n=1 Tax=Algoriphagus marinus TaxID=1925762 RepID=UPI00094BB531|nr:ABC transporter ATP-binding protein [Algoriphagus marinus]
MSNTVIKVKDLSKRYRLGLKEKQAETLIGQIGNVIKSPWENLKQLRAMSKFGVEDESVFWALKDINFEVKEGEVLGIIGKNGAGKSTLLKILSQITEPTSGKIEIHGRVASLLEVGTGFHPELSGRENIYMNGTILGMTRREIDSKLEEIIDFSGVEKFIDTPVKFYSSGMKVRLGFSVAAHLEPEILIVDEVLAVGDFEFQQKCLGKMDHISKSQGRTVLLVSHNMGAIQSICTGGLVINSGRVSYCGDKNTAISYYLDDGNNSIKDIFKNDLIELINFKIFSNSCSQILNRVPHNLDFEIQITFNSKIGKKNTIVALLLTDLNGYKISTIHVKPFDVVEGENEFVLLIEGGILTPNNYKWLINVHDEYESFFYFDNVCQFEIYDNGSEFYKWSNIDYGKLFLKYERIK